MQQFEILTRVGYRKEQIEDLCKRGFIEFVNSDYVIVESELLLLVLERCLNLRINPKPLLVPPVADIDDNLDLLYRYIQRQNYALAAQLCDMIIKDVPSGPLKLLRDGLETYPDNLDYILDPKVYNNDTVTDGLHKLERRLLIQLEQTDYNGAFETLEKLNKIYPEVMDTAFFNNIYSFLNLTSEMNNDHSIVSKSDPTTYTGDASAILTKLVQNGDIYRAQEVVKDMLREYPRSVEWNIYVQLLAQLAYINQKNTQITLMRGIINTSVGEDINEAFPNGTVPRIKLSQLEEMEANPLEELDDHDFFEEYQDALYIEHNYRKAKEKLLLHMKQDIVNGISEPYDYLIEDLKILIRNEELGVDMSIFDSAYEFGLKYMDEGDYKSALSYMAKASNALLEKSAIVFGLLAKCFKELGMVDKAKYYYCLALDGTISPAALIDMIEVCILTKDYDTGLKAIGRFDYYYPNDYAKVRYMAAIIYEKLGLFDDARDALEKCTEIIEEDSNIRVKFDEEIKIISNLENNKSTTTFGLDDYVEYENDPEEEQMSYELDNHYHMANEVANTLDEKDNSFTDKIKYILSVAKLLIEKLRYDEAVELALKVEPYVDDQLLIPDERKTYKKMVRTFKQYEETE